MNSIHFQNKQWLTTTMSDRKKNHSQVFTYQSFAILPANSRDCWRAHAIAWRVVYQFTKKFDRNDEESYLRGMQDCCQFGLITKHSGVVLSEKILTILCCASKIFMELFMITTINGTTHVVIHCVHHRWNYMPCNVSCVIEVNSPWEISIFLRWIEAATIHCLFFCSSNN